MKKLLKRFSIISSVVYTMVIMVFVVFNHNLVYAKELREIDQVKYLIQNVYIDDVPKNLFQSDDIEEIVKGVKDPYTQYFTKDEYKKFEMAINNSFCGIGIYQEAHEKGLLVQDLLPNSPAKDAGIEKGDIILKVDGTILKGLQVEECSKYLRGEEGTIVNLEILRNNKLISINVKRRKIEAPTVQSSVLDGHIGYISISSFGQDTPNFFHEEISNVMSKKVDKLIVDLRNNTGGYTNAAYNIAGYFIGEDTVIKMKDKIGRTYYYKSIPHNIKVNIPTIFLINEYTASASELLSSAVKDYKKAFFLGKKSFGKGIQQTAFSLIDGGVLKLTTNEFYSPIENNKIQKVGIEPDFNTKDVNSFLVAYLLYSGKDRKNKSGLVKVKVNNKDFIIDLDKAREKGFRLPFKYIINNCDDNYIYIGSKDTWVRSYKRDLVGKYDYDFYFKDFNNMESLFKNKDDISFKVKFNKDVDLSTINKQNIKLIDSNSFKVVDINYDVKGDMIYITSKEKVNQAGTYYLVIEDLKSEDGKKLRRNTIIDVDIK